GLVEAVDDADALDRLLRDAVHHDWCGNARRLKDRRHDIDDMVELPADATLVLDLRRPRNRHALAGAAEERRDLLGPFIGRVECPGPSNRIEREGLVGAPDIVILQLFGGRHIYAVDWENLRDRAIHRAFRAPPLV